METMNGNPGIEASAHVLARALAELLDATAAKPATDSNGGSPRSVVRRVVAQLRSARALLIYINAVRTSGGEVPHDIARHVN